MGTQGALFRKALVADLSHRGARFAVVFAAYSIWAARAKRDNIAHEAHLDGAMVGLIFVALTDFAAWKHAFQLILN